MKLHELTPGVGSITEAKRKGRGPGTGNGKTAGKGHKGQKARSGFKTRRSFEGGQNPLTQRLPKRGFNNSNFSKVYSVVNLSDLERCPSDIVTIESLMEANIIKKANDGLKVLARGEIKRPVTVKAAKISAAAKEKIEAAGGKAEVI